MSHGSRIKEGRDPLTSLFGLICTYLLLWMFGRFVILYCNVLWEVIQIGFILHFFLVQTSCLLSDLTCNRKCNYGSDVVSSDGHSSAGLTAHPAHLPEIDQLAPFVFHQLSRQLRKGIPEKTKRHLCCFPAGKPN